jgi:hypothetical protein
MDVDNAIPAEARLAMYLSACFLQELEIALRLAGIPARYERPGMDGIIVPRLRVEHPGREEPDEVICTLPPVFDAPLAWHAPDPRWWFMWWMRPEEIHEPICEAVDMNEAAHLIAARLREETR